MTYEPLTRNAQRAYKKIAKVAMMMGYGIVDYKILSRMFNKEFKTMRVRFQFTRVPNMEDWVLCTGYYLPPGLSEDYRYEVNVQIGGKVEMLRREFYTEIFLVLVHEFRHGHQYRARNFRNRRLPDRSFNHDSKPLQEEIRYLMDYDEIDAYAMEIAESRRMNQESSYRQSKYIVYKTAFPQMIKPWKKLMKKIYKYSGGIKSCYL